MQASAAHGCIGEARDTRFRQCAQELIERPGRTQVGRLLLERGSDRVGLRS